jgi:hypothetical protein
MKMFIKWKKCFIVDIRMVRSMEGHLNMSEEMVCWILWNTQCSKWKFRSSGICIKSETRLYCQNKWIWCILINDFLCVPDILLKVVSVLTHILQSSCFLDSSFLSKVWSTCSNISMAVGPTQPPFTMGRLFISCCDGVRLPSQHLWPWASCTIPKW